MGKRGNSYSVGIGAINPNSGHSSTRQTQERPNSESSNTAKDTNVETPVPDELRNQKQQAPATNDKAARSKESNNGAVSSNDNGQANETTLNQSKRVEELQTQLKKAKSDVKKFRELLDLTDADAKAEISKRAGEYQALGSRYDELVEENHQLALDLRRANENLRSAHENAKSEIDRLRNDAAERDAQIRQLVDKVTRDKVEGRWNPLPDSTIRQKFNHLNDNIRDWSKAWANKDLKLNHMSRDFTDFLSEFVAQPSGGVPQYLCQRWREKLGYILLQAALSHEIHKEFFENPFWLVGGEYQAMLTNIFNGLKASNAKEAHIWRASLWRLLNPPSHVPLSTSADTVAKATRNYVRGFCENLNAHFREGPAAVLFAPTDSDKQTHERANKLGKIMSTAADIATILWTQHSYLSILDLKFLQERNMRFQISSPYLEGHPLSKVDVDDDSHNGEGIIVVTRPALLAFDADDVRGVDGNQYRVLEKATVLLKGKK